MGFEWLPKTLTVLAGAALLAACTTESSGHAEPVAAGSTSTAATTRTSSAPSPTQPAETLPSHGAPKVANPLGTSQFQANPCLALSSAQSQELNVGTQGKPDEGFLGKACEWRNSDTGGLVILSFLDQNPRGLSATYEAGKDGRFAYFVPLPDVEGYPAVASDRRDDRPAGRCIVTIGVSDTVAFDLGVVLSRANVGKKEPCEVAAQVAGMALRTMKAGG